MLTESTSPEEFQAVSDETDQWDVRGLLSRVEAGTLVFGLDAWRPGPLQAAQDVAAGIPGALLILVHEDTGFIQFGDREMYADAIETLEAGSD